MSGKIRQKQSANANDLATLTVNEKILKECHNLYTDPNNGLVKIAEGLGFKLLAPRKKIVVLLIGNHSAGKSTFINWYIEEHVQKTGVAIETQGFTFITSGKKRESLTGNATLHLYPHFKPLQKIKGRKVRQLENVRGIVLQRVASLNSSASCPVKGCSTIDTFVNNSCVVDYLNTEISTSRQKKFSLVTFVDTPGLVDGDMNYPFDVNQSILWLGDMADLVFVFFDPIGQALCKRTVNIVEKLNEKHSDRIRYYLSKADEAGHECDRQRVMMQIVQELCKRPALNRTCFDMPTIYIPNPNKASRCANQIEESCKEIEKTINQTIQNTLNSLERDCKRIAHAVDAKLLEDSQAKTYNIRASGKGIIFGGLGVLLPILLFVNFLASNLSAEFLNQTIGKAKAESLFLYLAPVRGFWSTVPSEHHLTAFLLFMLLSFALLLLAKWTIRMKPRLGRKQKKTFLEMQQYVQTVIKDKKQVLYKEYLRQSIGDHDL